MALGTTKKNNLACQECPSKGQGIFCELESAALDQINEKKVVNNFKKGQTLFIEGNPPFGLYCISAGNIKVTKMGPDGKDTIVKIAGAGDVLGHRSLFSDEPYQATATAIEDTKVCFLDKKYITKLVEVEPTVAGQIIGKLSRDLGASQTKIASLTQKPVQERLVEFLLLLAQGHGEKQVDDSVLLQLKLTREEMASSIGTATETLIRCLSDLNKSGAVRIEGKKLFLLPKLEEFVEADF